MAWIVRLVSIGAEGEEHSTDVMRIAKPDTLSDLGTLGLSLAESKQLLAGIQREIVAAQARVHAVHRPECRGCGAACRVKDYRHHAIATPFGQVASDCLASAAPDAVRPRRVWNGRHMLAPRRSWTGCGRSSAP